MGELVRRRKRASARVLRLYLAAFWGWQARRSPGTWAITFLRRDVGSHRPTAASYEPRRVGPQWRRWSLLLPCPKVSSCVEYVGGGDPKAPTSNSLRFWARIPRRPSNTAAPNLTGCTHSRRHVPELFGFQSAADCTQLWQTSLPWLSRSSRSHFSYADSLSAVMRAVVLQPYRPFGRDTRDKLFELACDQSGPRVQAFPPTRLSVFWTAYYSSRRRR